MKKYELAKEDYEKGLKYREIADKYDVSISTVKSWKSRYWSQEKVATKDATLPNNRGAPDRNKNAVKHGLFANWLPSETLEIMNEVATSKPEDIIWNNIMIQYTAIIRAQKIMYVSGSEDLSKEVSKWSSSDSGSSEEYAIQYAWDKHANFLNAQSRAMSTLSNLIKQFVAIADEQDTGTKITSMASNVSNQIRTMATTTNVVAMAFSTMSSMVSSIMRTMVSQISKTFTSMGNQIKKVFAQINQRVASDGMKMAKTALNVGKMTSNNMATGIRNGNSQVRSASSQLVNSAVNIARSGAGSMRAVGYMIGLGLAQGMRSSLGSVTAAANALVAQAERAARAKAKIHSPSRLFRDNVGRYIPEGIAVGITRGSQSVDKVMARIYDGLMKPIQPETALATGRIGLAHSGNQIINNTYHQNEGIDLKALARVLNDRPLNVQAVVDPNQVNRRLTPYNAATVAERTIFAERGMVNDARWQ
ncbi:hypothetical protein CUS80_06880 [Enterococcus faecium]|nr:hypothetical protein CUS80_06880 [Enterococcus faecium]